MILLITYDPIIPQGPSPIQNVEKEREALLLYASGPATREERNPCLVRITCFVLEAHEKQVFFSLGRDVDETFCLRVPIVRTDGKDWHPLWITDYYLHVEPPRAGNSRVY